MAGDEDEMEEEGRFKLCCCSILTHFWKPKEPALSLSTFLSIFCEFKFISPELVSNQNQPNPWTILSLFAVNPDTPPVRLPSSEKPQEASAGQRAVQPPTVNHNEGRETRNRGRDPVGPAGDYPWFRADLAVRSALFLHSRRYGGCREISLLKW